MFKCCPWSSKKRCDAQSIAHVVDGKLILSLLEAENPVVWQMELDGVKASALEVNEKSKKFHLSLKTMGGDISDIAVFEQREQAVTCLSAASRALQGAEGAMKPSIAANAAHGSDSNHGRRVGQRKSRWGLVIGLVVLLFVLLLIWANLSPQRADVGRLSATAPIGSGPSMQESGVPLSADEFLMKR